MSSHDTAKSTYKNVLKHSSIYMAGTILAQAISFVMLPIYTRFLSPADYGVLELMVMTVDVVSIIIGVGLPHAIFRFYSEKPTPEEKKLVISTAMISGMVLFATIAAVMFVNASFFSRLLFGSNAYTLHFRVIFVSMALSSSVELPMVYFRARALSTRFVVTSTAKIVLQLSLNIFFVVYKKYGVLGVLYSTLISSLVFSAYLVTSTLRNCGFGFSLRSAREMFGYGFPLVFSQLGAFVLTFADRYFIKAYFELREVGLYSLGYKFGSLITALVLGPFFQHWPSEMFEIDKRPDRERIFVGIFEKMFLIFILLIFVECVFIKEAIRIIADPEYLMAYTVVAIVCLAYYFSMLMFYVQLGILIKKQTKYVAYATLIAALANLGFNFLLIPRWGMYGAAISTVISYAVRFALIYRWSQMVYPLAYRWRRLNALIFYAAGLLVISYLISPESLLTALAKDMLFTIIFVATFMTFWLKRDERKLLFELARRPHRAIRVLMS